MTKKSFNEFGGTRGEEEGNWLLAYSSPAINILFFSTLSVQGTHFTLSNPPKFWIHNMPEDHQSCLIPFSTYPETIIQMFATYM